MLRPVVCSSVPRFDLLLVKVHPGYQASFFSSAGSRDVFVNIFIARFQQGSWLMTESPRGQEWPTTLTNFS